MVMAWHVHHAVEAGHAALLQRHPVLQRAEIIAKMQRAGRLHAGQEYAQGPLYSVRGCPLMVFCLRAGREKWKMQARRRGVAAHRGRLKRA